MGHYLSMGHQYFANTETVAYFVCLHTITLHKQTTNLILQLPPGYFLSCTPSLLHMLKFHRHSVVLSGCSFHLKRTH